MRLIKDLERERAARDERDSIFSGRHVRRARMRALRVAIHCQISYATRSTRAINEH